MTTEEKLTPSFEERLQASDLPGMAKLLLPSDLSRETMNRLAKRADMVEILKKAIDEIDHGSVETIESLVKRMIDGR